MSYTLRTLIVNRKLVDEDGVHRADLHLEIKPVKRRRYFTDGEHRGNNLSQSVSNALVIESSEEEVSTEEFI